MAKEDENMDKLEQKKQELEEELKKIQHELDDSFDQVRTDVSSKLHPVEFVKNYPLPAVGLSVLIGFLAGNKNIKKMPSDSSGQAFHTLLWSELKKIVTKKAVSLATDYTEKILMEKREEIISSENGSTSKDQDPA